MAELMATVVLSGTVMGIVGWLANKLWQARGHAIKTMEQTLAAHTAAFALKADKSELALLAEQHRDDHREVMGELRNLNEIIGGYTQATSREIAVRPTREEVDRMIERSTAGGKR